MIGVRVCGDTLDFALTLVNGGVRGGGEGGDGFAVLAMIGVVTMADGIEAGGCIAEADAYSV